jgi:NAD(P)-dependent dehydrogenase (short-subunit alcohol dehydrogenase family)
MKSIVITGGTSGLGLQAAFNLGSQFDNMYIIGKNEEKGQSSLQDIKMLFPKINIKFIKTDLSLISEIKRLSAYFFNKKIKIDILINNAGGIFFKRTLTSEKIEKTFALNHLAYFALTNLFLKNNIFKKEAKIINVASGAHRGANLNFTDIEMKQKYNGWLCYKKSKLCNILFTKKLSELTKKKNITVNCLHPGFVKTGFGKNNTGIIAFIVKVLMKLFAIKVEDGAKTIIHLATSNEVKNISGEYFYKSKITKPSHFAEDKKTADKLWKLSLENLSKYGLTF